MTSSGLLAPVSVGHDSLVSDEAVLTALVRAEIGLVQAWAAVGALPAEVAAAIAATLGEHPPDVADLAAAAVDGGNPVIPLVPRLKAALEPELRGWVHRGATSQDILDTALMLVARDALASVLDALAGTVSALDAFADENRDRVAVARTLGQHAVPTTVGERARVWRSGIRRAVVRLEALTLPAQLGGAAGTRAAFRELGGDRAAGLPAEYAAGLGLDDAGAPWHTTRWPVTELADALTQTTDALGKFAGDVVTLARPEIGELTVAGGGGSSAMPQKNNPVAAILIRSAALRAPQVAATLHLCAADAADERPPGTWHAEWPTLIELLRLALGASAHAARLAASLGVDPDAVARNLALSRGLVLAERVSIVLTPLIGAEQVTQLIAAAGAGADLASLIRDLPEAADLDVDALLDPAGYLGEAGGRS